MRKPFRAVTAVRLLCNKITVVPQISAAMRAVGIFCYILEQIIRAPALIQPPSRYNGLTVRKEFLIYRVINGGCFNLDTVRLWDLQFIIFAAKQYPSD